MRAWQFTAVGEPLQMTTLPDPEPGPREIVVAVKASGLCHSDVSFMDGTITALLGHLPIVLGHEIAGEVTAVGSGVGNFAVGDRVGVPAVTDGPGTAMNGGFAELVRLPAALAVRIPDEVSYEQAAPATDAGRTAYRAIHTAGHVTKDQNVGIVGFGGLGSLGAQIALAAGAAIYVADTNSAAQDAARALGASGVAADIRDFEAQNLDVIVDFAGFGTTTASAIDAVRPSGRVVQIGLAVEMTTISAQKVVLKDLTYVGASNGEQHEFVGALNLLADGMIRADTIPITFDQIPDSLRRLQEGGVRGRFVVLLE
ncbi:alcohol dehydrogenase catalytic domain-containing protein [Saccharopolyspora spinosa]|uniref:alcohol dehydrogenase n=1 Tax=Saccharopolyspora spinosa TaxID=60894 RepID=A0A2N3Y0E2_SACSN|nr:zinc-binding dehydrogenase [Saccharopolyspora spinosa]PKW16377.1 propanol-preferring alcohol dehydrogenase [Saccharopolyspora spinosa]